MYAFFLCILLVFGITLVFLSQRKTIAPLLHRVQRFFIQYLFVFIFIFLSSIFLVHYSVTGQAVYGDGIGYYAHLHSWYFHHSVDTTREYLHIYTPENNNVHHPIVSPEIQIVAQTKEGNAQNFYGTGPALLLFPFYAFADFITIVVNTFGTNIARNGYADIYQIGSGIGAILYVTLGLFLLYKISLSQGMKKSIAKLSAFTILLASPLIYYGGFDVINSHFASFFLVCTFLFVLYCKEKTLPWMFILGCISGVLLSTRPQDILIVIIFSVFSLAKARIKRTQIHHIFLSCIAGLLGFGISSIPQCIQWIHTYDSPLSHPYISGFLAERTTNAPIDILGSLFHPQVGLFSVTPLILVIFVFYFFSIKKAHTKPFLPLFIFFVVQFGIITVQRGWYAQAYGGRMYISTLPFFYFILCHVMMAMKQKVSAKAIFLLVLLFSLFNMFNIGRFVLFTKGIEGKAQGIEQRTKERIQRISPQILKILYGDGIQ